MQVTIVSEGTYPMAHGGVSVWCDQLVRGLAEHSFEIVAITASGQEKPVWTLPSNVTSVRTIPLWGPTRHLSTARGRRGLTRSGLRRGRGRTGGPELEVALQLGSALFEPDQLAAREDFRAALQAWAQIAPTSDVEAALLSPAFIGDVMQRFGIEQFARTWGAPSGRTASVADAVVATRLIGHALRPLTVPPPRSDLVHLVANGIAGLTGMSAKWRYGTPFVLSEHGVYLRERYLSFGASGFSWPAKWLLLRFHRLLTSTVYTEAALVAPGNVYNQRWELWDGVPDDAIRTVYNGVDPSEFDVAGAEPSVPTLTWVGRIDPIKDLETLIRSFALVHAQLPPARLRIFGSAPRGNESYLASLQELVRHLGLADVVTFEGRVESVRDAYVAGHVVVLTSISEGFPYTVIEAMSCARATVSSDVGGVHEAVGDAGLVVPPRDAEAFAAACLRLLRDEAERQQFAARARSRVIELFTLERSLDDFRSIYAEVGRRPARSERVPA